MSSSTPPGVGPRLGLVRAGVSAARHYLTVMIDPPLTPLAGGGELPDPYHADMAKTGPRAPCSPGRGGAAGLLQGTNGVLVIDARDPGHTLRDFDFTCNSAFQ
jgi:hypothetical protein